MADILIERVESVLMPGLREAIEVKEIGTPLTNMRYTGHPPGAAHGGVINSGLLCFSEIVSGW
jgi:prolycopene isomerase